MNQMFRLFPLLLSSALLCSCGSEDTRQSCRNIGARKIVDGRAYECRDVSGGGKIGIGRRLKSKVWEALDFDCSESYELKLWSKVSSLPPVGCFAANGDVWVERPVDPPQGQIVSAEDERRDASVFCEEANRDLWLKATLAEYVPKSKDESAIPGQDYYFKCDPALRYGSLNYPATLEPGTFVKCVDGLVISEDRRNFSCKKQEEPSWR